MNDDRVQRVAAVDAEQRVGGDAKPRRKPLDEHAIMLLDALRALQGETSASDYHRTRAIRARCPKIVTTVFAKRLELVTERGYVERLAMGHHSRDKQLYGYRLTLSGEAIRRQQRTTLDPFDEE